MSIIFKLYNRPNKKKYDCPECGHKRIFTRYIDVETLDDLGEYVGICDRLNNCGYHYTPKQYFQDNKGMINLYKNDFSPIFSNSSPEEKIVSYIDPELMKLSLKQFEPGKNAFFNFLTLSFSRYIAENVCRRYKVGNSNHWPGANVFWQVDIKQKVRTGKIMLYDSSSGKRVYNPYSHINWIHSVLQKKGILDNFNVKQCFFGEHILKYETDRPVAIVESEKTAIICYLYMPQFIWLASGQAQGLNIDKCRSLQGRKVVLFPDLKMLNYWEGKAKEIRNTLGLNITVNDTLETMVESEDIQGGFDLADYLLNFDDKGKALHDSGIPMNIHLKEFGTWKDSVL